LPGLDETATVLREVSRDGASYATLVTGPSRTADIERQLTVGVQGPAEFHVVFVDDLG
jgi:L-lactate dehydrogenase complex protein LldG